MGSVRYNGRKVATVTQAAPPLGAARSPLGARKTPLRLSSLGPVNAAVVSQMAAPLGNREVSFRC